MRPRRGVRRACARVRPARPAPLRGVRGQQDRDAEVAVQLGEQCQHRRRRSPSRGCRSARRRRPGPAGGRGRGRWLRAAPRRPTPAAGSGPGGARCRPARPVRAARASASAAGIPASRQGRAMLSPRVSVGSRLKNWKTKPMRSRRSRVSASSSRPPTSRPSIARRPRVRPIHRAAQVQQRGLAAARRPHQGHEVAGFEGRARPRAAPSPARRRRCRSSRAPRPRAGPSVQSMTPPALPAFRGGSHRIDLSPARGGAMLLWLRTQGRDGPCLPTRCDTGDVCALMLLVPARLPRSTILRPQTCRRSLWAPTARCPGCS